MGARFNRFGGKSKGTLRPDRTEKRQDEAGDRKARYEHELATGQIEKKGDSIHFKK